VAPLLGRRDVGRDPDPRRKLHGGDEAFRRFHAATRFLPFTGRDSLRRPRELSPLAVGIGVVLTTVLRVFHGRLFGP
jgi:hypothetical protein